MDYQIYVELLKENNLSDTKQRRNLFSVLSSIQKPISIAELSDTLKTQMDRTTVYRALDSFEKAGIVNKIYSGWKQTYELSERFHQHHHHMTCVVCGRIIPFEESQNLIKELRVLEQNHHFFVEQHSIELRGRCALCIPTTNVSYGK